MNMLSYCSFNINLKLDFKYTFQKDNNIITIKISHSLIIHLHNLFLIYAKLNLKKINLSYMLRLMRLNKKCLLIKSS